MKFSALAVLGTTQALTKVQISEIFKGYMEGALKEEGLQDWAMCEEMPVTVEADIKKAIADLEEKSISGVVNGLDEIADTLYAITGAYKVCTSAKDMAKAEKVEAMLKTLKNPVTLATDVYHNLKVNGKDITAHIDAAADDWKNAKYQNFGEDLGFMVAETVLGDLEIKQKELNATNAQIAFDISYGVLLGAVNAEGLENMSTCFSGPPDIINAAEVAIKDFKAGGVDNTIHGLKELAVLVTMMKQELAACKGVTADWKKLEAMAAVMSSPTAFAYHVGKDLLLNGHDIYDDIETGITDYDAGKWEPFGQSVGNALAKLIIGEEPEDLKNECEPLSESQCHGDSGCSWCTSFAVKNKCNTVADAKTLPASIFICDNLGDKFLF